MTLLLFLAQAIRIAVPYLFAAAGGALAERAGIVSLSLEGYMLGGAFGAVIGAHYTDSAWLAVVAGVAAGLLLAGIHAVGTLKYRADQVVTGVAINLFAVGITRFFLQLAFDSSSNSPRVVGFGAENAGAGLALASNPLVWAGLAAMPVLAFVVGRTTFGLRVRAVGEHPAAAASVGVPVRRVRYVAVLGSGMLAALGGTYLALDQHQFTDSMTAGRGFIALAAVIFGRWDPLRAGLACLLFAGAETLQIRLQAAQLIPSQFVAMIPYVLTIVAVAGVVGRSVPPADLGRTADG
ncbi:MAG TPA: ABC transporter permease [Gemmatimonadaceae bacterium]|nr:ABC transporter permease [Gemmatimonadaceae bacterium]